MRCKLPGINSPKSLFLNCYHTQVTRVSPAQQIYSSVNEVIRRCCCVYRCQRAITQMSQEYSVIKNPTLHPFAIYDAWHRQVNRTRDTQVTGLIVVPSKWRPFSADTEPGVPSFNVREMHCSVISSQSNVNSRKVVPSFSHSGVVTRRKMMSFTETYQVLRASGTGRKSRLS